jgi:outer membrane lipase/esterase
MLNRTSLCFCAIAIAAMWGPQTNAQTASQALDSSWVAACAEATPGTAFYDRCQEILNAGPGSGARRSAAALGNNLEIFAAQGRMMMAMAKARGRAAARAASKTDDSAGNNFNLADATEPGNSGVMASGSRWSLLGSFSSIRSEHTDTGFERGYDDSGRTYLLGLDYRWNDHWTSLLALQRESRSVDFERISGAMDSDTDTLSAALSYTGGEHFSASLAYNAGRLDSVLQREINYTLTLNAGQPTERRVTISSEGESHNEATVRGADLNVGWDQAVSAWTFRYGADLSWQKTNVDRIAEDNAIGLDFLILKQEVKSVRAGVGIEVARAISIQHGVLQPYLRVHWNHEFADDPRRVFAAFRGGRNVFRLSFLTGEPDRNYGEVGLGVVGIFPHGWQGYAGWQRTIGGDLLVENRLDVGWRREF